MTQCSARHEHHGAEHYCISDANHPPPHECEWGHTWGMPVDPAYPAGGPVPADPVLPYPEPGGTEATTGWSGSDTSHERAERERDDGTVSERQQAALTSLGRVGSEGLTWKELGERQGWHHGQSSSTLSVLHKDGRIARLVEKRDRCHVYVASEYVNERDIQPHGGRRSKSDEAAAALAKAEQKLAVIRGLAEKYALLDPSDVLEVLDAE